jgi:hypothetical protein
VHDAPDDAGAARRRDAFRRRRANARHQAEFRRRRRTGAILTDRLEVTLDMVAVLMRNELLRTLDRAAITAAIQRLLVAAIQKL